MEVKQWRNSISDATSVSWVKGHAEDVHIRAGQSNATHQLGNDFADGYAKQGANLEEVPLPERNIS